MADSKGVALAIFGIIALIAIVGLVLLFSGKLTGQVVNDPIYGLNKVYGGWDRVQQEAPRGSVGEPYAGTWVKGVPYTQEGIPVSVVGGSQARYRVPTPQTTCPASLERMGTRQMQSLSDDEFAKCVDGGFGDGSMCCPMQGLITR